MGSSSYGNYLAHYGVLGMKWGVHRARKNQQKAAKARAKGNTEAANKYAAKAKKIEQKHVDRTDRKTYNRVKNTSAAKLYGQSLVLGTYGALKYNQARANGGTRGKSIIDGLAMGVANDLTSGLLSIAEPRANALSKRSGK